MPTDSSRPRTRPLQALCEAIWRIEHDFGLLQRKVAGVHYWPLVRARMIDVLSQRLGFMDLPQPQLRRSLPLAVLREMSAAANDLSLSPWSLNGRFDTIVVPFGRKHLRAGRLVDGYSDRVFREAEFGRCLVLDGRAPHGYPLQRYNVIPPHELRSRDLLRTLALALATARLPRIAAEASRELAVIEEGLRKELSIACPMSLAHFSLRIATFLEGRTLWSGVLTRSGARIVFLTGNHTLTGIGAAALDLGLKVVEFQHGLISTYQGTYHYPGRPSVPYAPERLLTFGAYWTDGLDLPANTISTPIGVEDRAHGETIARIPRRVLIPSQWSIGRKLFELALKAARQAPDWEFVYRPHPLDNALFYREQLATRANLPSNLRLSPIEEDIYALMESSEVQIGLYSTALFEGMTLGLRTIIVDLPGVENLDRVLANGDAVLARDAEEIVAALPTAPAARRPERYYEAPVPSIAAAMA